MKIRPFRILNIGCGKDTYGTHFIDLYPANKKVKKRNMDYQKLPYPDNYFGLVYTANLIEHLRNPKNLLEEANRVLKKGGLFTIITDNAHFLGFHFIGSVHTGGYEKGHQIGGIEDRHYCLMTMNHLQNHLYASGFKAVTLCYIDDYKHLSRLSKKHFCIRIKAVCVK